MDSKQQSPVLWGKLFSLAGLYGGITFAWIAYVLYLPKLLVQVGFPVEMATVIVFIEGFLVAAVEPWMGTLSDKEQRRIATRYPLGAAGAFVASLLFVLLPLVAFANPGGLLRWVLPALLIAWAFAMSVFRSPSLALLNRYAAPSKLPLAAGVLSTVAGLVAALGPFIRPQLLALGPMAVFTLASIVLLVSVLVLSRLERQSAPMPHGSIYISGRLVPAPNVLDSPEDQPQTQSILRLSLVFLAGAGASLGLRLLVECFPKVLLPLGLVPGTVLGVMFLTFAGLAVPAGMLAVRVGNGRTMFSGLVIMAALLGLIPGCHSLTMALLLAVLLGASNSLVSNGLFAFALGIVPRERAGLGIGLYFGGGGLAMAIVAVLAPQLKTLGVVPGVLISAAGFLLAALCVALSGSVRPAFLERATANL